FRLRRVLLRPAPFLQQVVREAVGIKQARHVAARARIAVPVPGAANPAAGLEALHCETRLAQAMHHVDAAEARADHDRVDALRYRRPVRRFLVLHANLLPEPPTRPTVRKHTGHAAARRDLRRSGNWTEAGVVSSAS